MPYRGRSSKLQLKVSLMLTGNSKDIRTKFCIMDCINYRNCHFVVRTALLFFIILTIAFSLLFTNVNISRAADIIYSSSNLLQKSAKSLNTLTKAISYKKESGKIDVAGCVDNVNSQYAPTQKKYVVYDFKTPVFFGISNKNNKLIKSKIAKIKKMYIDGEVSRYKSMCHDGAAWNNSFDISTAYAGIYKNRYATFTLKVHELSFSGVGGCNDGFFSYTLDLKTHKFKKLSDFAKNTKRVLDSQIRFSIYNKYVKNNPSYEEEAYDGVFITPEGTMHGWNPTSKGLRFFLGSGSLFACAGGPSNVTIKWSNVITKKPSGKIYKKYLNNDKKNPQNTGINGLGGGASGYYIMREFVTIKGNMVKYSGCYAFFMSAKDAKFNNEIFGHIPPYSKYSQNDYSRAKMNAICKKSNITVEAYGVRGKGKVVYVYPDPKAKISSSIYKIKFYSTKSNSKIKYIKRYADIYDNSITMYGSY